MRHRSERATCAFLVWEPGRCTAVLSVCTRDPKARLPASLREVQRHGPLSLVRGFPPVGVVEAGVSLGRQSPDLLPVGNELLSLHLDLRGAQRVGLLQAVGLGTQGFDLETPSVRLCSCPMLTYGWNRLLPKPTLSSKAARSLSKPSCFRSRA